MTPEFSRPERLDTIGTEARTIRITADQDERDALARRFDLIALRKLEAEFAVRREGEGVLVTGRVTAAVAQACAVSGEPLQVAIDEPVTLRFVAEVVREEEIELDADAIDTLPIEGTMENGAIDLGEAAAETLALAIDPFLRAPGASEALADAGAAERAKTGAFAGLKGLLPR